MGTPAANGHVGDANGSSTLKSGRSALNTVRARFSPLRPAMSFTRGTRRRHSRREIRVRTATPARNIWSDTRATARIVSARNYGASNSKNIEGDSRKSKRSRRPERLLHVLIRSVEGFSILNLLFVHRADSEAARRSDSFRDRC